MFWFRNDTQCSTSTIKTKNPNETHPAWGQQVTLKCTSHGILETNNFNEAVSNSSKNILRIHAGALGDTRILLRALDKEDHSNIRASPISHWLAGISKNTEDAVFTT